MALVHELAVAHGGHAELRNRQGGGAEALVRLPAQDVAAEVEASSADTPPQYASAMGETD